MSRIPNAASVALIDHDKVLLIQRARKPYFGLWSLPGGRLEPGETAEQAAEREIMEELGLRVWRLHPIRRLFLAEGRFVLQVFATEAFEGEIVAVRRGDRASLGPPRRDRRHADDAGPRRGGAWGVPGLRSQLSAKAPFP